MEKYTEGDIEFFYNQKSLVRILIFVVIFIACLVDLAIMNS